MSGARTGGRGWALGLAALLLASAATGRAAVPPVVSALLASGLLAVAAWSPRAGLAAVITAGMLSPWALPTGTRTDLDLIVPLQAALCAGWLVRALWRRDLGALQPSLAVLPLGAFGLVASAAFVTALLTTGCGHSAPLRAQAGALAGLLLPIGTCVVAADALDRRWAERLTWLLLALGGVYLLGRLVPALVFLTRPLFDLYADGSLFWVWLVALAGGQAVANRRLPAEWRLALAWCVVLLLYIALHERPQWLGGWVPPLAAVAVTVAVAAPRLAVAVAVIATLVALPAAGYLRGFLAGGLNSPDNLYSLGTRLDAWAIVLRLIAAHPLLGLGPANYYHCTPLYPIRGYTVHFSSHNNYLDVAAQTGVLGLLCLLGFAGACAGAGLRLWRHAAAGFERGFACGCLGGLCGTLVAAMLGDWWLPFVYNLTLRGLRASLLGWIFLGAMLARARDVDLVRNAG